ncbi:MAG: hypothetical protein LBI59_01370, partial [Candidatus Accumulibacter sp.]|nr:hypothetical protein [Accumulibacter sp.]
MEKPAPDVPWYKRPGGILFIHFLRTVGLGFIAGPLAASFALFFEQVAVTLPLAFLAGIAFGALCAFGGRLPPAAGGRYLLPLGFSWVMIPAFFPFILVVGFSSALFSALRFLPAAYVMGLFMGYVFCERRRKDKVRFPADCWVLFGLLLALPAGCIVYGVYQDKVHAARRGHGFERVGGFSSTDLKPYDPRVPGAITPRLAEPSSFTVRGADKLPVLDGAEAAFPVYAAFAAACYPDLPRLSEEELRRYDYRKPDQGALTFTNTIYAFQRLIEGEVDIFFGAQPSENQKQLAADKGKELVLTPIAKEA